MGVIREVLKQIQNNEMKGIPDGAASWHHMEGVLLTTEEAKRLLDMISSDSKVVGIDDFQLPTWSECDYDSNSPLSRFIKKFEPENEPKRGQFRSGLFGVITEICKHFLDSK